ncbi:MAG: hydroxymethylbilane synthase [Opitutales bacterium]
MPAREISPLVLATRRSPLALRQAALARDALAAIPSASWRAVELLELTTTGDRQRDWSLADQGGKGLFTRELEEAVLDGRAHLAVHSAKDLPTTLPDGLVLAGFLPRADARDVLVRRADVTTPRTVATGSPRRRAQAQSWWPKVEWRELRGNVETRLKKIAGGEADATFLAAAGLERLGLTAFAGLVFEPLPVEKMIPAAGQGAIALESRAADTPIFSPLLDRATATAVFLERAVLAALGGGCQNASAVHFTGNVLHVFHENRKNAFTRKPTGGEHHIADLIARVRAWLATA